MTRLLQFSAFLLALIVVALDAPIAQAAVPADHSSQSLKADDTTETEEPGDDSDIEGEDVDSGDEEAADE